MSLLPFGTGAMSPLEAGTERGLLVAWVMASAQGPAAELQAALTVPVDLVARRRAELGVLLRGETPVSLEGYEWSLERIEAFVAGVSSGRDAVHVVTRPAGPGSYVASWPGETGPWWHAWERHPQRHDLWREVGVQVSSATLTGYTAWNPDKAPPVLEAPSTPAVERVAEVASAVAAKAAADMSTAPVAAAPSVGEVNCVVCGKLLGADEVARRDGERWSHFACARVGYPLSNAKWGEHTGARIRSLRKGAGQVQADLVGCLGSQSRVSAIELGNLKPLPEEIAAVANRYGVTVDVVLGTSLPPRSAGPGNTGPPPAPVAPAAPEPSPAPEEPDDGPAVVPKEWTDESAPAEEAAWEH